LLRGFPSLVDQFDETEETLLVEFFRNDRHASAVSFIHCHSIFFFNAVRLEGNNIYQAFAFEAIAANQLL
jgi:hypothetical protein